MTDKSLIHALLTGSYISRRHNRDKRFGYGLYSGHMRVSGSVSSKQFQRFGDLFKERRGRFTFNLNLVRQMHGKSLPKKMYKQSKQKQHVTPADSAAA